MEEPFLDHKIWNPIFSPFVFLCVYAVYFYCTNWGATLEGFPQHLLVIGPRSLVTPLACKEQGSWALRLLLPIWATADWDNKRRNRFHPERQRRLPEIKWLYTAAKRPAYKISLTQLSPLFFLVLYFSSTHPSEHMCHSCDRCVRWPERQRVKERKSQSESGGMQSQTWAAAAAGATLMRCNDGMMPAVWNGWRRCENGFEHPVSPEPRELRMGRRRRELAWGRETLCRRAGCSQDRPCPVWRDGDIASGMGGVAVWI